MTELIITPNYAKKTARFKGTIAAGEHVLVKIANAAGAVEDTTNLRLRVVGDGGKTLAQFPMPDTEDAWDDDTTPISCVFDLNTDRMLKAVPLAATVPLLFVLDAYKGKTDDDDGEFVLFFKDRCEVTHWPRRAGEDEPAPTVLDDYADLIADFGERLDDVETSVETANGNAATALAAANGAVETANAASAAAASAANSAASAAQDAETAVGKANDAIEDANDAVESAEAAAENANTALSAAQDALETAESIADGKQDALTAEQLANIADVPNKADADDVEAALADKADKDALHEATEDLEQEIADRIAADGERYTKSETYSKGEIDALVSGAVSGRFAVVESLPETGEANAIYLVPNSSGESGNVHDEYVWVDDAWEKIGSTQVDVSGKIDKVTGATGNIPQFLASGQLEDSGKKVGDFALATSLASHANNDDIHFTVVERTKLSGIESGAQKNQDISGKAEKSEMSVTPGTGADADKTTIQLKTGTSATVLTEHQSLDGKQDVISDLETIRTNAATAAKGHYILKIDPDTGAIYYTTPEDDEQEGE